MARDPIEPAKTLVSMLAAFVAVMTAITLVAMSIGTGSLWGLGEHGSVCARGRSGAITLSDYSLTPMFPVLEEGVSIGVKELSLCADQRTALQSLLDVTREFPGFLLLVCSFLLALSLFRLVRKDGLFTSRVVARMRLTGWFVIVGNVVVSLVMAFSESGLAKSMVADERSSLAWWNYWEPSIAAIVLGTVLVSVARILGVSTAMREDLEGTV